MLKKILGVMIGPDFDKGLASMKTIAEGEAAKAAAALAPEAAPVDAGTP